MFYVYMDKDKLFVKSTEMGSFRHGAPKPNARKTRLFQKKQDELVFGWFCCTSLTCSFQTYSFTTSLRRIRTRRKAVRRKSMKSTGMHVGGWIKQRYEGLLGNYNIEEETVVEEVKSLWLLVMGRL